MATSTDQTQKTANNSTQAEVATNKAVPETAVEVSRSGTNNPAAVVVPGNEPAQTVQAFDGVEVDVKETETNAEMVESFDEEAAIEELLSENPDGELPESAEGVLLAQADMADETAPAESGEASSAGGSAGTGAMSVGQIGLIGLGALGIAAAVDSDSDSSPAPAAEDGTASPAGDFTITTGRGGLIAQASEVDSDVFDGDVNVDAGDYDGLVTAVISVENGTLDAVNANNTTLTAGDPTEATYVGSADGLEVAIQALTYTPAVTEAGTDTVSIDVTDNAGNTLANYEETISIGVVVTNADAVDGAVTGSAQADEIDLTQTEFAALTSIDGGDGVDGLDLTAIDANITEAPTIESIEYVMLTTDTGSETADIDTSVFTGVDFFVVQAGDTGGNDVVTLSELDGDETLIAGENFDDDADTITFNLAEEQAAGKSLTVEANEFAGSLIAGTAGDDGERVERMTVDVTETIAGADFEVDGNTGLQELTLIGGDAADNGANPALRINTTVDVDGGDADAGLTVDASGFDVFADGASTPGVTLDVTGVTAGADLDLTGSDGDDTFTFTGNNITADDSVDGGAGDDSLASNVTGDIGAIDVSNVETVTLTAAAATTIDFANAQDIENLVLTADENHTLKNLNSQTAIEFSFTDFGTDAGLVSLGLAAGESHDVTFSAIDAAKTLAELKASESASSLSLTVNGGGSGALTITDLTSENLETLTVDGTEDLVITNTVSSSVNTVDASESAGDVTVSAADATGAVTITGGDGGDTFTGGAEADTISGGAGDDTITGGAGADTLTGGDGADDFIQTDQVVNNAVVADEITDFNDDGVDQIGNFSVANLETLTALTDLINIDNSAESVGAEAVVTDEVAAATDAANLNDGTNLLLLDDNLADTDAVETALETGGDLALTVNGALAAGDGFLVAYDDDTDTNIALVTTDAAVDDDAIAADGDLTVVNLVTLSGVADATSLGDGNFLDYLA